MKKQKYRYFYSPFNNCLRRTSPNSAPGKSTFICIDGKLNHPIGEDDSVCGQEELLFAISVGTTIEVTYQQGLHYCKGNYIK